MIQSGNCETGNGFDKNSSIVPHERSMYSSGKQECGPAVELFSFDHEYVRRLSLGDSEIERHFIGMQLNALGVDPTSDEGRKAYKDEYGYTGVFSGETPEEKRALGAADATQTRGELPEEYQREHLRYGR